MSRRLLCGIAVAGRRTKMVQLVEITGVLNEKGCIEIPIVLLAQTGICIGEEVKSDLSCRRGEGLP